MKFVFIFVYHFLILFAVNEALKCHQCYSADYLPANVINQLQALNISIDDTVPGNMTGNCKSEDSSCSNRTWCAKKTVSYKINFNSIKYKYKTSVHTCVDKPDDDQTTQDVSSGKCYDSSTADDDSETGISRSVNWCYCNNKDFCNNGISSTFSLFTLLFFAFSGALCIIYL